jgi:shikimate kinase
VTRGARHLVLVGMMATGKSSVGALVASRLGRPLLDSDEQIEARAGRTVREIWRSEGEQVFRRLEAEVLADALASPEPVVVAAAGGVVLDPGNRACLRDSGADVVWLRARPETLLARLQAADHEHRPLLDDDPEGTLVRMHQERSSIYAEVSGAVVDVDELPPEDVADRILAAVAT